MSLPSPDHTLQSQELNKDKPRTLENYLPPNYPKILFQGTSLENSLRARDGGLGGGTLSTWIFDSLDARFYRPENGRLLISIYEPNTFQTGTSSEWQSFQYYSIREKTGPMRLITFTNVDTDTVPSSEQQKLTDRYVNPSEMGSVSVTQEQRNYLGLVADFLSGHLYGTFEQAEIEKISKVLRDNYLPDSAAGVAGSGLTITMLMKEGFDPDTDADLNYRRFILQQQMSSLLGLRISDFSTPESLKNAVVSRYNDENGLIQRLTEAFPDQLNWDWKNMTIEDSGVIGQIIRQAYQMEILMETSSELEGDQYKSKRLFVPGESIQGLNKLRKEKGLPQI